MGKMIKGIMYKISENLAHEIGEKGYETSTCMVRFPKYLRDKFRKEIGDYHSDKAIITTKMIEVYNNVIECARRWK